MIQDVFIADINLDHTRFQNRNGLYSDQSVQRIVENYDERLMLINPVALWKDPEGVIWLLAGHSRLEAHKRLNKAAIKAVFFSGTQTEAMEYARNSNNQSSRETVLERVKLYREQYAKVSYDLHRLQTYISRYEDKRSIPYLLELLHLNPNGNLLNTLGSLLNDMADQTQRATIESIASIVGRCRIDFADKLTDAHENEMLRWLLTDKNLKGTNKAAFLKKIKGIVEKDAFSKSAPLNLNNARLQKQAIKNYEAEEARLVNEISGYEKKIEDIHRQLCRPCSLAAAGKFIQERNQYQNAADAARLSLGKHRSRKEQYEAAAEVEYDMFNLPPETLVVKSKRIVAAKQNTEGSSYRLKGVSEEDTSGMVPMSTLVVGDRYRRKNKPTFKIWEVLHVEGNILTVTSGPGNVHTAKGEANLLVYKIM